MARNFSPNRGGSLAGGLFSGVNQGEKEADDENSRRSKALLDAYMEGLKFYKKPVMGKGGYATGYETNEEDRARDASLIGKSLPGLFQRAGIKPPIAPPAAPSPAVQPNAFKEVDAGMPGLTPENQSNIQKIIAEGRARKAAAEAKMQAGPAPLISNPEEEKLKQTELQAKLDVERDKQKNPSEIEVAPGIKATPRTEVREELPLVKENGKLIQPYKQSVAFEGLDVNAPVSAGSVDQGQVPNVAQAPQAEEPPFNPSDVMLARYRDMVTTPMSGVKGENAIQGVPAAALDPEMLKKMGLQGYGGIVPFSAIEKAIARQGQIEGQEIGDDAYAYAERVRSGEIASASSALRQLKRDRQDAGLPPPNKQEASLIRSEGYQSAVDQRQQRGMGERQNQFVTRYLRDARKTLRTNLKDTIEGYQASRTLLSLANEPNNQGFKRAMQTMTAKASGDKGILSNQDVESYGGMPGWAEKWQQFVSDYNNVGLTPENNETFKRLATAFSRAAEGKFRAEVQDQIASDSDILSDYGVPPSRIKSALSFDAILKESKLPFEIPPKTQGRRNPDPRLDKPSTEDIGRYKSAARTKIGQINSQNGLKDVEKQSKVNRVLKWYKDKTGQDYFKKVE